ncbi:MAG: hypothetical protein J5501_03455 [Ruminococcus sp.]|nr:hypothetical protein [Ruminococcus sp.]
MTGDRNYSFRDLIIAAGVGFAAGLAIGAAVAALIDDRDEKCRALNKLEHDSDENYYYSTD